ncbi:MAG: tyrosine-type recombinase/integrase [Elusimicrobiota bacterium]
MEIERNACNTIDVLKKAVIKLIKHEFDAKQQFGYQYIFGEEWRTKCVDKLEKSIADIKESLFLRRQNNMQKEGGSQKPENDTLKDELRKLLKECMTGIWFRIRFRKNMRTQTMLAQQLIFLASHEKLLGDEAFRLKLQYFSGRKTVVKIGTDKDMGLNNALAIRDLCVFNRLANLSRKNALYSTEEELGFASIFGIVLAWEGLDYGFIRDLLSVSFDCSEGRNILFLTTGSSYRTSSLSRDAWAVLGRLAKRMPKFFGNESIKGAKTLNETYPGLINRMRSIVRAAGNRLNISSKWSTLEAFRQMGIYYRLIAYLCKPAYLAEITTSERSTNILAPQSFYPGYIPKKVKLDVETQANIKEVSKDDEEEGIIIYLSEYFSDILENIDKCHSVVHEFTKTNDRNKVSNELDEYLKEHPDSRITKYAKSLFKNKAKSGKRIVAETVYTNFLYIKELFLFRILSEVDEIYEEDLVSVIIQCKTQDGEALLNKKTLTGFEAAYRHYEACMKEYGTPMPEVRWGRMKKYCDTGRRLIVIPEERKVMERIGYLLGSEDEQTFDMGMIIALAFYCGLRSKEAYSFQCEWLYCVGEDEYYIEILGKGNKPRRVDLSFLPFEYRELFIMMTKNMMTKNTAANGKVELFGMENKEKYKYRFGKFCKEDIFSGMHSLRHAFAIRHLMAGMDPKKVASILGHETIRVLHNTYDQSSYLVMKDQLLGRYWEKEFISREEAMCLLRVNEEGLRKFLIRNKISSVRQKGANRKEGGKTVFYNYRQLIDKCYEEMINRTSQIGLKSREALLWKNCSRKPRKISAEQKKLLWKSLKSKDS